MFLSSDINKIPISKFPYPYRSEVFTQKEKNILLHFFTNIDKPVFVIHNLPQEIVGAMFSRYSRSSKSVRRLFLDEFWSDSGVGLKKQGMLTGKELTRAKERTAIFYKRVFAEYGDDSVIQMGSVHVAFEFVSHILGAKSIEDQRIGAAYIEKSTRYVDFGTKINNHYLFMIPPEFNKMRFEKELNSWSSLAFNLFNKNLPIITDYLRQKYPIGNIGFDGGPLGVAVKIKDVDLDQRKKLEVAYERALKAKAFDTARFFLPTTMVTNLGAHFSGHAAENAINKMIASPYREANILGILALKELLKVAPNFFQNIDYKYGELAREYRIYCRMRANNVVTNTEKLLGSKYDEKYTNMSKLVYYDKDADIRLASQILYTANTKYLSKEKIIEWCEEVKKKETKNKKGFSPTLIKLILNSIADRNAMGLTRRHKLPRAFEHVFCEVEFYTDIGTYKDLQRNRMSSTERQIISANDLYIPVEYKDLKNKGVLKDYLDLAEKTKLINNKLVKTKKYVYASEYITILGNKVRFNIKANLRQWVFFSELRTISGGHPTYRKAMQEAACQIIEVMPFMKKLFTHVDWTTDYGLGRLKAEISTQEKFSKLANK